MISNLSSGEKWITSHVTLKLHSTSGVLCCPFPAEEVSTNVLPFLPSLSVERITFPLAIACSQHHICCAVWSLPVHSIEWMAYFLCECSASSMLDSHSVWHSHHHVTLPIWWKYGVYGALFYCRHEMIASHRKFRFDILYMTTNKLHSTVRTDNGEPITSIQVYVYQNRLKKGRRVH